MIKWGSSYVPVVLVWAWSTATRQAQGFLVCPPGPVSLIARRPTLSARHGVQRWATVSEPQTSKTTAQTEGTVPFDADGKEAVFAFERRLKEAGIETCGLEHAMFLEPGETVPTRGLRATRDTPTDKPLISLPRSQAIYLEEDERSPFPQWVPQKQWQQLPWYARLGLKLVYERKISTSPLKTAYAELLPAPGALPTPLHWSESELEELNAVYPSLVAKVERQRVGWSGMYDALGKTRAVREDMDEPTFVWAMESVLSRAFKGSFGTGFRSFAATLTLMLLFAGIYQLDQETIQVVSYVLDEYPWTAALPAAMTLVPLFLEFRRSKGTYVLAPMIDSLNHKTTVPTELDYDSIRQRFQLNLEQPFKKGQQVFMSYGLKSNDDLVQNFGFVEADNPADTFEFGDLISWLQEHRAQRVNDERLQTLYSKGLQDAVKTCKMGRGGKVDPRAMEGLRILLASDDELRAENEITESIIQTPMFLTLDEFEGSIFDKALESQTEAEVWGALTDACEYQREVLAVSADEERRLMQKASRGSGVDSMAPGIVMSFRREKVRLLDECIVKFRSISQRAPRAAQPAAVKK